jgi:hypothetical protein
MSNLEYSATIELCPASHRLEQELLEEKAVIN